MIPTIYLNSFSEEFLLYHGLNFPGIAPFSGLLCLIGVIAGITGVFERKVTNIYRTICLVCALLCGAYFVYCLTQLGAAREKPKRIACSSNLKQIYLSLQQYAMDYNDFYPPENGAAGLETLRKNDYLTDHSIYICPSTSTTKNGANEPLTEDNVDYVYVGGLKSTSDSNLPLAYDKAKNHGVRNHGDYYGNVLFANGTVKGIEGNPWTEKIK